MSLWDQLTEGMRRKIVTDSMKRPEIAKGVNDMISIQDQIACVRREVKIRERVYKQFIEQRKMSPEKAASEIAAMKAALQSLMEIEEGYNPDEGDDVGSSAVAA